MSAKQVIINDVRVSSSVGDNQRTGRGIPDLYVLFISQFGDAGNRTQFQRNNASPTFEGGPFALNLGGPRDVEEFNVEIWDYDGGRQSNDDMVERVIVSLGTESATGSRTWPLSRGGSLTFAWRIEGRPEPAAPEPPAGERGSGNFALRPPRDVSRRLENLARGGAPGAACRHAATHEPLESSRSDDLGNAHLCYEAES